MVVNLINDWGYRKIKTFLPGSLANPILWLLHSFPNYGAFKMTQIIKNIGGETSLKNYKCLTYQDHNPEKTIFVLRELKPPLSRPSAEMQLNFIHFSPSMGYIFL